MKCNNCCALRTEGYEYPKSYCYSVENRPRDSQMDGEDATESPKA